MTKTFENILKFFGNIGGMASSSDQQSTAAIGKITCGDLVVHPTKPWPWIGTVQPKVGDFARLCTSCGGLRVPSKDANTQYKLRIESEEGPVPLCESEHEDSPTTQDICVGGEGAKQNGRCYGDCGYDDDERMSNEETFFGPILPPVKLAVPVVVDVDSFVPPGINHLRDDIVPPPLVALSVEGALPGRHFQVNWFPSGDLSEMDGKEKVIIPFKQRSLFQEGSPVAREGALNDQGLVKQVHRTVDAFVLPNYGWIIHDLPASKLKPLMDIEQCPGCFVIHKGWVGTVYNVWYRITFRMEDGTEFVLTDDQGEVAVHMREENRKAPCVDINQMYPGLKLKLRWMLLDNVKWPDGYDVPEEIQSKITRSRDKWNSNDTPDPAPAVRGFSSYSYFPSATVECLGKDEKPQQSSSSQNAEAKADEYLKGVASDLDKLDEIMDSVISETAQKMDIHIPEAAKRELSAMAVEWSTQMRNQCDSNASAEDMASVTVVKMEPLKLDVEWLSQVVADVPAGPKGNVIEGDELNNIYIFRSSRFFEPFDLGVRYRYVVEPGDQIVPSEIWRRRFAGIDDTETPIDTMSPYLSPQPKPGDCIYVAIARSSSKIDILWEDGRFETGVEPESLVAQYTNQTERDYFPAMYVTFQSDSSAGKHNHGKGHYHRGKSDSGMDDTSQTTGTSGEPAVSGCMAAAPHSSASGLPSKFGVVKKAKNSEKYATVAWYEMKKRQQSDSSLSGIENDEPTFLNEEDVSFYDLKFYYEFNYVGGTLVSRVHSPKLPPGTPNVGYVLRKNPDATVQVVWHDGKEETTQPWKLRQLTTRYDSEYTASDVDDEQHYYSPTEHEYEDLEDFRYYDYTTLSADARQKRIGLIVAVMREVISRICKLTLMLDNYFPYADRKKVVKLTLSCNDVCNGFANLSDFRDTVKEMFEQEQQIMNSMVANGQTGEMSGGVTGGSNASGTMSKLKLWKGRFVREERLVWQCANWLYDWTEAMTTLQDDMKKYRHKILRKEQQAQDSTSTPTPMDTATLTPNSANFKDDAEQIRKNIALCAYVADLQSAIETGLSTVTGILSVPAGSDVTGGLVVDFLNGLTSSSPQSPQQMPELFVDDSSTTSIDEFATFGSSHKFLRTLVENPSKVGRLPCFSYTHHSELELSALYKQWPQSQFSTSSAHSENLTNFVMTEEQNDVGDDGPKSCQTVVDGVGKMIEDVLHGRRDISYTDDNVLKLCNETADALCLSVMSIMIRIIESIYVKLRPQIDSSLNESRENEKSASEKEKEEESIADGIDFDESVMDEDAGHGYVENHSSNTKLSIGASDKEMTDGSGVKERIPNGDVARKSDFKGLNGFVSSLSSVIFELLPNAPPSHRFFTKQFDATVMPKTFLSAVRKEIKLLHSSLPPGIFVKTYEDRMDLFSCMIVGPQGTPYADGVFFFDARLKDDYPTRPPHLFYKSMSKLLNPNLYEDGMVCLSLLGTWDGKETELWTANSNLLQVFVSIQSLILVSEPYFNEPGFEKEKGSQTGATKSRDYNEAAVLRTLESLQRALNDPPEPFRNELHQHITENSGRLFRLLEKYQDPQGDNNDLSFPLFPVTQGFCLCIKRHAENLRRLIERWPSTV